MSKQNKNQKQQQKTRPGVSCDPCTLLEWTPQGCHCHCSEGTEARALFLSAAVLWLSPFSDEYVPEGIELIQQVYLGKLQMRNKGRQNTWVEQNLPLD